MKKSFLLIMAVGLLSSCAMSPERAAQLEKEQAKVDAFPLVPLRIYQPNYDLMQEVKFEGMALWNSKKGAIRDMKRQCMNLGGDALEVLSFWEGLDTIDGIIGTTTGSVLRGSAMCLRSK